MPSRRIIHTAAQSARGFTLVELLVAIAVMAVLSLSTVLGRY